MKSPSPARRTLLGCLLLPAFIGAPGALARGNEGSRAAGEPDVPSITLVDGIPISLEGRVVPGEWGDAAVLPLAEHVTAFLKRCGNTWLLAVSSTRSWPQRARLLGYIAAPDATRGHAEPGTLSFEFDAYDHDRPHLIVRRQAEVGSERVFDRILARATTMPRAGFEMAVPVDLLPAAALERGEARVLLWWTERTPEAPAMWPATTYAAVDGAREPPVLRSVAAWARVGGIGDPSMRPAFSNADWEAALEHQRRIDLLGKGAHTHVAGIEEEWRISRKEDAVTESEVFAAFREIARSEPLTARDRLAWAMALRWLNRHDAAIALFDAIHLGADSNLANAAAEQRAYALEGAERYEEAALAWEAFAARPGVPEGTRTRLANVVAAARAKQVARNAEHERRRSLEARDDLPLLQIQTNRGSFFVILDSDSAPQAAAFIQAQRGGHAGTLWHDVRGEAWAAGGIPATRERGIAFQPEDRAAEAHFALDPAPREVVPFFRGAFVVHARKLGESGMGWMVLTGPREDLAGIYYRVVGHVAAGQDVVDRLEQGDRIEFVSLLRPGEAGPPPGR